MSITIPNPPGGGFPFLGNNELQLNRTLTRAFIQKLPVTLILLPRAKEKKPGGGFAWVEGELRDPQVFTIIEQGTVGGLPRPVVTQDGVERIVEFQLLGEWDAIVARFDTFEYQGKDWEVIDLFYENGYEQRALISARG